MMTTMLSCSRSKFDWWTPSVTLIYVALLRPTSPTKRKGGVTVEQVPHKITMPAVPKKSMASLKSAPPLMDPKNNPFVVLDDDEKPAVEEQSPRKK